MTNKRAICFPSTPCRPIQTSLSSKTKYARLHVLYMKSIKALMTVLRSTSTNTATFRFYADRVHRYNYFSKCEGSRILVEEGVCILPETQITVSTPCGTFQGVQYPANFCAVSIMRSGDALLQAFIDLYPEAPIGKVLIQRDETSPDKCARVDIQCCALEVVLLQ